MAWWLWVIVCGPIITFGWLLRRATSDGEDPNDADMVLSQFLLTLVWPVMLVWLVATIPTRQQRRDRARAARARLEADEARALADRERALGIGEVVVIQREEQ